VDNTNPSVEERARYTEIARSGGFRLVGYYFRSPPKEALTRNARRTGKARIPEKGILGTHKRLRVPRLEEGFDELYYVRIDGTGRFVVEEWSEEL
jgi:predicted kinase